MPTVYLMYEQESRELESRIYLAQQLLHANFEVVIFQHTALWLVAARMRPGFICLKSTSYQFDSAIDLLSDRGFKIVCWQEEGLHHFQGQEQSPVFSKNSSKLIDQYFAWHPADAELAVSSGVEDSRIQLVGNARFELLREAQSRISAKERQIKRILILTNFDKSDLPYDFSKDLNLDQKGRNFAAKVWETEKKAAIENLNLYKNFFQNMNMLSNSDVRVRPYFYEKNQLHLEFEIPTDPFYSISESLENCDLLVHYGSTGGIEAATLGIPNLILASSGAGIDSRIFESGLFFDSIQNLISEIEKLSKSEDLANALAEDQYKTLVRNYGFDLRNSKHASGLVTYCQTTKFDNYEKGGLYLRRAALLVGWSWKLWKYTVRKKFGRKHVTKARPLDSFTTSERIWILLRSMGVSFTYSFGGRAVLLSHKSDRFEKF